MCVIMYHVNNKGLGNNRDVTGRVGLRGYIVNTWVAG